MIMWFVLRGAKKRIYEGETLELCEKASGRVCEGETLRRGEVLSMYPSETIIEFDNDWFHGTGNEE